MVAERSALESLAKVILMGNTFWKNKTVFLTGHTGFKGSWLALWLQKYGANIVGLSLQPPSDPSLFVTANVANGMTSISGDIRNLSLLQDSIDKYKPDIVIHMAAQTLVRPSYDDPIETYSSNVMGTVNVLEAIRTRGIGAVKSVVIVTSDKCYENKEWLWGYRENERMGGKDPYSNSKGCAELVVSSYRDSFFHIDNYEQHGVAISSVRAGNVIGGGDWAKDRLIPDAIKAISKNTPVVIRSPNAVRPWQHVLEPLSGYMDLAEKLWLEGVQYSGGWNFGPNEDSAKKVSEIMDQIVNLWGDNASWEIDEGEHVHEANYLKLDCAKAKDLLGFNPKFQLQDSLAWAVDWYKAYHQGNDMHAMTLDQINRYEIL